MPTTLLDINALTCPACDCTYGRPEALFACPCGNRTCVNCCVSVNVGYDEVQLCESCRDAIRIGSPEFAGDGDTWWISRDGLDEVIARKAA